jgi:hypothetical protein
VIDPELWAYQILLSYCRFGTRRYKPERFALSWDPYAEDTSTVKKVIPLLEKRWCTPHNKAGCPSLFKNGTHLKWVGTTTSQRDAIPLLVSELMAEVSYTHFMSRKPCIRALGPSAAGGGAPSSSRQAARGEDPEADPHMKRCWVGRNVACQVCPDPKVDVLEGGGSGSERLKGMEMMLCEQCFGWGVHVNCLKELSPPLRKPGTRGELAAMLGWVCANCSEQAAEEVTTV